MYVAWICDKTSYPVLHTYLIRTCAGCSQDKYPWSIGNKNKHTNIGYFGLYTSAHLFIPLLDMAQHS